MVHVSSAPVCLSVSLSVSLSVRQCVCVCFQCVTQWQHPSPKIPCSIDFPMEVYINLILLLYFYTFIHFQQAN